MMQITFSPDAERLVREKLQSGDFDTPEAVVLAGLQSLSFREDDFEPGEMQRLVDEGMRSLKTETTVPADVVFAKARATIQNPRPRGK